MLKYVFLFLVFIPFPVTGESIKIGVNTFLTGPAAHWGNMTVKGLELALEEENALNGINGIPIEILYSDFGNLDYKAAANATHKFVEIDRVKVIFANVAEDAEVIYPIAAKALIPVVAVAVGSERATLNKRGMYRTTTSDLLLWQRSIDFLSTKHLERGCFAVQQSEYFIDIQASLEQYWKEKSGTTPIVETYNPGERNFAPLALRWKKKKCTTVLLMGWISANAELIRKMAAIQYTPQFIALPNVSGTKEFLNLVQGMAEGLVFGKFSEGTQEFRDAFKRKYGVFPERPAATSYDALKLVAHSMRRFGTKAADIHRGLSEIKDFNGASGVFSLNADGTRSNESHELYIIKNDVPSPVTGFVRE